jgi:hypothetical protein
MEKQRGVQESNGWKKKGKVVSGYLFERTDEGLAQRSSDVSNTVPGTSP